MATNHSDPACRHTTNCDGTARMVDQFGEITISPNCECKCHAVPWTIVSREVVHDNGDAIHLSFGIRVF